MNLNNTVSVMRDAAKDAGEYIFKRVGRIKRLDYKGDVKNLVTDVDKGAERIIIKLLKKSFPEYGFLAEESGLTESKSDYRWVIDPLDGTTNFAHGFPHFSVSIALEHKGKIIAGTVYDPVKDEMFYAYKGGGAYLNKKRITVSKEKMFAKSLLATGFAYDIRTHAKYTAELLVNLLLNAQELRRAGSAALDLSYIACGRFEGYWERGLSPWDTAAGFIIVEEAGGKVTNFNNRKYDPYQKQILATNGKIHKQMLKIINNKSPKSGIHNL
ncbi:MAG: inositol monophosphatase family protein [Elusimicrobiota bacterium]